MKDNKYDFLDKLGELDDDEIEMISEEYPFADRHDKLRIARLCEETFRDYWLRLRRCRKMLSVCNRSLEISLSLAKLVPVL